MYIESHTIYYKGPGGSHLQFYLFIPPTPSLLVLSLTLLMHDDNITMDISRNYETGDDSQEVKIVSRCKAVKEPLTLCKSLAPIKCSEF